MTVCWPTAWPSRTAGVTTSWATREPVLLATAAICPALTVWPPSATSSSVNVDCAAPVAGVVVVAARAGAADAARRSAAETASAGRERRTTAPEVKTDESANNFPKGC